MSEVDINCSILQLNGFLGKGVPESHAQRVVDSSVSLLKGAILALGSKSTVNLPAPHKYIIFIASIFE